MFGFFKSADDRHFVLSGRIYCPIRKTDTDIDNCYSCPRLIQSSIAQDGVRSIRCTTSLPPASIARQRGTSLDV